MTSDVMPSLDALLFDVRGCTRCADALPHGVRPIVQASSSARLLVIGQAPGSRVHASGIAWNDDSGNRLFGWTGIAGGTFHDPAQVAVVPMGLCYPGSDGHADKPPRRECAPLWHDRLLAALPSFALILLVGGHAQAHYLPAWPGLSMTERVRRFAEAPAPYFPLPHPSWRVVGWMRRNPWFADAVLPALRARVAAVMA